ncbi:MAG: xanthine dehydrogenase family protein subunit M [Candidatus Eisenbacteria bacterium]|nr:xanthine dehydrogenase family protein subunit M [Candidatus Eisenbacteria bacterium]
MSTNFSYVRAASLDEAATHLAGEGARLHAGGTDLLGCLHDEVFSAEKLVSISRLDDLRQVRETADGGLRIGALVTISDLAAHPAVRERYACLAQAASEVASPQLRNQGTIGGNICQKPRCWYYRGEFHCLRKGGDTCFAAGGQNQYHCIFGGDLCFIVHPSDTAPALVALDATARVRGSKGEREVKLSEFHVPPAVDVARETVLDSGEIVTEIHLPAPPPGLRSSYRKVRARRSWDFALAGVALALTFEGRRVTGGRVVLSGAAPVPWRSRPVEEAIIGKELDDAAIAAAAEACVRGAQPLEQNGYKVPLFKGVMEEELRAIR